MRLTRRSVLYLAGSLAAAGAAAAAQETATPVLPKAGENGLRGNVPGNEARWCVSPPARYPGASARK
jgi:hypothetical protein